ncbi:S4 domain-containing protein [Thauera sp.]|jgi:23S rRNA (cytidine1920-2'-O)/16S rRNA (cytidine1409-2'-O)-methyltransferase|uniref:S4 domain-containing protein n=1 Tax=Thauera sp. TaxID=1905334 RepID=UPI002A36E31F|nr:S4 domain-containing protein [Thauera sp.]MDX9885954.1 S4 domain-containing protein [Thauera sp.]
MSMNSFHARQGRPRQAAERRHPADRHGLLRVDQLLVMQGLAPSRAAARALVATGRVSHDGHVITKPALALPPEARLAVTADDSDHFVPGGDSTREPFFPAIRTPVGDTDPDTQ